MILLRAPGNGINRIPTDITDKLMNYIINGYEPAEMFHYFEDISAIPHGSGNEKKIADYIEIFAKERNLYCYRDRHNNIFIRKSASKCFKDRSAVLLQGHTDMVCEKDSDVDHDFEKDGLRLYLNEDYLRAQGTTLGADDGAAVALMLTLLNDKTLLSPTLECLFTTEEETGLTGAKFFDYSQITAKTMINLDGETEGEAWVSCAGGIQTRFAFKYDKIPIKNKILKIRIKGLAGGHSGADIDKNHTNAIKLMGRILLNLYESEPFNLISIHGGNKINAIPRECEVFLSVIDPVKAVDFILTFEKIIRVELSESDGDFKINIDKSGPFDHMMTYKSTSSLLSLITLAPNGINTMSSSIPSLVESSINPGIIACDDKSVYLSFMSRSSVDSIMDDICLRLNRLAKITNSEATHSNRYSSWTYNPNSRIQTIYIETYNRLFTENKAKISSIHAGLECGIIKQQVDDLDIIAIGPEINHNHSPHEEINLKSLERLWILMKEILKQI